MNRATQVGPAEAGRRALQQGQWAAARDAFELASDPGPDALDGLATARWWLGDVDAALQARAAAYAGLLREGRADDAVRVAVWLAREHLAAFGNAAVASGWLARARRHAAADSAAAAGWVALAQAEVDDHDAGADPVRDLRHAVALAGEAGDADLEIRALGRLGVALVARGDVEDGLRHLDEAMAAATAGEGMDPQTVGEACCALLEAAGLMADPDRVARWAPSIDAFRQAYAYPGMSALGVGVDAADLLSAFCGSCCGGIHLVTGRLDDAEVALQAAVDDLRRTGMTARCVHPAAGLAELRVLQGRLQDAELVLAEFPDRPECVTALAVLELARGSAGHAATRLADAVDRLAQRRVAAFPMLSLLVDAHLAGGDVEAARAAADELAALAAVTRSPRHAAQAAFAAAKVAAHADPVGAQPALRAAAVALADAQVPLEACRARLAYARSLLPADTAGAITEARAALLAFERMGASLDADLAAAFLRDLGVRGRTGAKDVGLLTDREQQVLRLVSEGCTNPEIADRLHISTKTAGHHVSNILAKLGLRSRTEAAAYAVLHLPAAKPRTRVLPDGA